MRRTASFCLLVLAVLLVSCGPATTVAPTLSPLGPEATATSTPTLVPVGGTPLGTPAPTPAATPAKASAGPKYGGTFRGLATDRPDPWDPHLNPQGSAELRTYSGLVLGQLFTREWPQKGKCAMSVVPDTVESWKWLDPTAFEFKLRQGVRFHNKPPVNGRELTSSDAVFTLKRLGENMPGVSYIYKNIDDVSALDRYTVRIKLKAPYSGLVAEFLAFYRGAHLVAPEAAAGPKNDYSDPYKSWIGVGPFQFDEWVMGVKTTFTKNPGYFKPGRPYVDRVEMALIPDQSTRVALLLGGRLDIVHAIPVPLLPMIRSGAPQVEIQSCPYWAMGLSMDMRTDLPPFNDVRVRRAMSMAIDRHKLVDTVLMGNGTVEYVLGSHHQPEALALADFPAEVRPYLEYHPDQSMRLLSEAGYPEGPKINFVSTRGDGFPYTNFTEAVASMLEKVGFKVTLDWRERPLYAATVQNTGDYKELAYSRSGQADILRWVQERLHGASPVGANRSRIKDASLDAIIDELARTTEDQRRLELWKRIQIHIADQAYVFQPVNFMDIDARQPWVRSPYGKGFAQYMQSMLTELWLDK